MYRKTILRNDLRIITVPMEGTKAVTLLVLVGTGSKYEKEEENGISHFLEHMFFKGTKKRPNQLKIAETLDRVGGEYNAFTGKEYTGYWAKVNSRHFDLALDWVSDVFLNSKIEEKEIEKEKGVIIEEINMYLDMPRGYVWRLWEKLLYGNQPAGWMVLGEKENIKGLKRKNFLNYLRNHYSAKNTIICVAGDIKSNLVEKKVKECFKKTRISKPKVKLEVIERQDRPRTLIHFKKTDQTHLCLGVRGYDLLHPKKYIQAVLATILGGMMSSRLFILIRGKGLAYYVSTSSQTYTDTGYLVTSAGIDNRRVEKAMTAILKEYKVMKNRKIEKSEIQKAKEYLKGILTLKLESSDAQASFYGMQELLENKVLTPEQVFSKIDAVGAEDVQELAKEIFQPEKLNLALIGPFKDKTKFQQLLKL